MLTMLAAVRGILPIFVKNRPVGRRSIFLGVAACSERVPPPSGIVAGVSYLTTTVSPPSRSRLQHPNTSTLSPPSLLSLPRTRLLHTTTVSSTDSSLVVDDGERDRLYSRVDVECRGHEPAVLRSYLTYIFTAAAHLGITVENVAWPKMHIERWTLLKSVHIHKKHRVQYEARTHFLTLSLPRLTGSTADTYLEYIQRNLPEGVAMKVTKHELQTLPPHVKPSPEVSA